MANRDKKRDYDFSQLYILVASKKPSSIKERFLYYFSYSKCNFFLWKPSNLVGGFIMAKVKEVATAVFTAWELYSGAGEPSTPANDFSQNQQVQQQERESEANTGTRASNEEATGSSEHRDE